MAFSQDENNEKKAVVYTGLTLILLVFIIQAGFGMFVNILRNIDIYTKLQIVNHAHNYSIKRNNLLKNELSSFNSAKNLESIARNNLKMAGKNEILLIINSDNYTNKNKNANKPVKEKGIFYRR